MYAHAVDDEGTRMILMHNGQEPYWETLEALQSRGLDMSALLLEPELPYVSADELWPSMDDASHEHAARQRGTRHSKVALVEARASQPAPSEAEAPPPEKRTPKKTSAPGKGHKRHRPTDEETQPPAKKAKGKTNTSEAPVSVFAAFESHTINGSPPKRSPRSPGSYNLELGLSVALTPGSPDEFVQHCRPRLYFTPEGSSDAAERVVGATDVYIIDVNKCSEEDYAQYDTIQRVVGVFTLGEMSLAERTKDFVGVHVSRLIIVGMIAFDPQHKGRGLSIDMMQRIISVLGGPETLIVSPDARSAACPLESAYRSLGFVNITTNKEPLSLFAMFLERDGINPLPTLRELAGIA